MIPIVFLDIDGVLNDARTKGPSYAAEAEYESHEVEMREWFEPRLVAMLNRVLSETGARVIVHSSWRRVFDDAALTRILNAVGITGTIEATDRRVNGRADSIRDWLYRNGHHIEPIPFVALDDDGPWRCDVVSPRHIQTDERVGLTAADCDAAVRMLIGDR